MKRVLYLFTVIFLILGAVAPAAAAPAEQGLTPQRPDWPNADENPYMTYLPMIVTVDNGPYTVSGYALDNFDAPIAGVNVSDGAGHSASTDINGHYSLSLPGGNYRLHPTKSGYTFRFLENQAGQTPVFSVNRDRSDQNFTGVATGQLTTLAEQFRNTDFEVNDYWNAMSGSAAGFTPYYVRNGSVAHSGVSSGFTGVPQGSYQYQTSASRYRSQTFVIPADATTATLSMWFWPITTDTPVMAADGKSLSREMYPDVTGVNTDQPESPEALEAFTGDIHYVFLIDGVTNNAIGDPIIWELSNPNAWVTIGDFDLLAATWPINITGRLLKIEFGTYNDTDAYKSSAYFDDVTLDIDGTIPGPNPNPTPLTCAVSATLMTNGGFETPDSDWLPVGPEFYLPDWAGLPEIQPFAGLWSYRTGIAYNIYNEYPGVWQWSEGYHPIDLTAVPAGSRVFLSAWMKPVSGYTGGPWLPAANAAYMLNDSYVANRNYLAQWDSQYMYLKGPTGRDEIDRLVEKWFGWNSYWWQYRTVEITPYIGQTMSVVFGAANNGWGSNASLYVDNVGIEVCEPAAATTTSVVDGTTAP
jgi:hypothetical protein